VRDEASRRPEGVGLYDDESVQSRANASIASLAQELHELRHALHLQSSRVAYLESVCVKVGHDRSHLRRSQDDLCSRLGAEKSLQDRAIRQVRDECGDKCDHLEMQLQLRGMDPRNRPHEEGHFATREALSRLAESVFAQQEALSSAVNGHRHNREDRGAQHRGSARPARGRQETA
jgi:hypothetical protein